MSVELLDEYDWEYMAEEDYDEQLEFIDDLSAGDPQPLWHAIKTGQNDLIDLVESYPSCVNPQIVNARDDKGRTALHIAITKASFEWSSKLISFGFRTSDRDFNGQTALHYIAVQDKCCWELLEVVLLNCADVNLEDTEGCTPLHLSCLVGNISVTQSLMLHGADINLKNDNQLTPLHLACLNNRDDIILDLLHKKNISTYSQPDLSLTDDQGRTVLHAAAYASTAAVVQILLNRNASIDAVDHNSRTPLLWALAGRNEQTVRTLLMNKANPNLRDSAGRDAGFYAALFGVAPGIELFLHYSPEIFSHTDNHGQTPFHAAVYHSHIYSMLLDPVHTKLREQSLELQPDSLGTTPLHLAIMDGNSQVAEDILLAHKELSGELIDIEDQIGCTPLHYAAKTNNIILWKILCERGANLLKANHQGQTPLHWASLYGSLMILQQVAESQRKHRLSMLFNSADAGGRHTLHLAAYAGQTHISNFLLQIRGIRWTPDRNGLLPAHYAAFFGDTDGIQLFQNDINRKDKSGALPAHFAALSGSIPAVKFLLSKTSSPIKELIDTQQRTLMFYANSLPMVNYLATLGLSVHDTDKLGRSLLFTTIQLGLNELFPQLVEEFALDVNVKDSRQISLLHVAAECGNLLVLQYLVQRQAQIGLDDQKRSPLYYAAARGYVDCVHYLLQTHPELLDVRDHLHRSALDAAAFGKHLKCVNILTNALLASSLDLKQLAPASDGRTPLHAALANFNDKKSDFRVLVRLLEIFDINQLDSLGRGCLFRAVSRNMPNCVRFLLDHGADVNIVDNNQVSCLMVANYLRSESMISILLEYSADESLRDSANRTAADYAKLTPDSDTEDEEYESEEDDLIVHSSPPTKPLESHPAVANESKSPVKTTEPKPVVPQVPEVAEVKEEKRELSLPVPDEPIDHIESEDSAEQNFSMGEKKEIAQVLQDPVEKLIPVIPRDIVKGNSNSNNLRGRTTRYRWTIFGSRVHYVTIISYVFGFLPVIACIIFRITK